MKYAIIIPDGAADLPIDELDDKTPLQVAETPNMDWIATNGKCGTVLNVPKGMSPGSDVAILSVLGYDPKEYYTGRGPLEAAAQGLQIARDEWVFRCNLVTIINGVMEDYSAGHISSKESTALLEDLNNKLGDEQIAFYPGVSYRHLMTYKGEVKVRTTPPHDITGRDVARYLPTGRGSEPLRELMQQAAKILGDHEVNSIRRDLGENPGTDIWLWGEGRPPQLPSFKERFGIDGAVITAVDLIRGIAKLIGWEIIEVPGATGYIDTNYEGKGAAAIEGLSRHDLVFVHVEAPDEAGHNADHLAKIRGIEQIDRYVVGPVLEHLRNGDSPWRILVLPDHPTPCSVGTHTAQPVPFAIAGEQVSAVVTGPFTEETASHSDLHIARGADLMEYFLKVR